MKQVYINYNLKEKDFSHEFNIIDEDDTSYLFRSNGSEWAEESKGGLSASIEDNGNGVVILLEGQKKIKLDYNQAQDIFILLLHTQDTELEFRESKTTMKWPLSQ
jgi:hypothetical protein